jgi:hypothetical protein
MHTLGLIPVAYPLNVISPKAYKPYGIVPFQKCDGGFFEKFGTRPSLNPMEHCDTRGRRCALGK